LGTDDILKLLEKGINHIAFGVGGFTDTRMRRKLFVDIKSQGFEIVKAIHPSAIISPHSKIGTGSIVYAGVVINPDVVIGENVIIANNSSVDHESVIKDHVLISDGVTIGGKAVIGEGAVLAIGSVIVSGKKVGNYSLVAAGAVVVNDVPDNSAVAGIPAKPFQYHN
jgi:UDP-perosamine 4-acetyltransferase